jgi:capsular polysaccharide transport system ATP-binding protein
MSYRLDGRKVEVLADVSLSLAGGGRSGLGIVGAGKAGKTTLLNIIAGILVPDYGRVVRDAHVSWPLSWRGIRANLTGAEQLALLARFYRVDRISLLRYVAEVSTLHAKLYEPLTSYSKQERNRLMQAAALGLEFEVYLVDDDIPDVGSRHAPRYDALWKHALTRSSLVATANHVSGLAASLPHICILQAGQLSTPLPPAQAKAAWRSSTGKSKQKI